MITFNNIPTTQRTPGAPVEIDNSRAIKGLAQNPHRVLIVGQKETAGSASALILKQITNDTQAAGYFGAGTLLDRMCRKFRQGNKSTEVWAVALSEAGAGTRASGTLNFGGSATATGTVYLLVGGVQVQTPITSGWSGADVCSAVKSDVNANSYLCMVFSTNSAGSMAALTLSTRLFMLAVGSCEAGNYFDARLNYYDGQSLPAGITTSQTAMAGGSNNPTMADLWAVADGLQFHHIVHPYTDATNMATIEGELGTRFAPPVELQGGGWTALRGNYASCAAFGLSHNSPYQVCPGAYDSPNGPEEWAAAWCAQTAASLQDDPGRPLHYLTLVGILPPTAQSSNRFTRQERNQLLYDGIATWDVDANGNVFIERSITMYRTNALGLADASYLDVETLYELLEIRYQYKVRMVNRFILPRFKLTSDANPIPAGAKIASPSVIKQEIVALFRQLNEVGLIENLDDFVNNLVVERDATDVNRVNALLAPDLVNQFRILATQIQFIL